MLPLTSLLLLAALPQDQDAPPTRPLPAFERIVIDDNFPGGYQVEVADVDGDGDSDLVALGGGTSAWYENPSWKKRLITDPDRTPGIISSATADLDGDGKAEVAIAYDFAMNTPTRGKLGLAVQGDSPDAPWTFRPIADVPSIHRIRWGMFRDHVDGTEELGPAYAGLVVAPIFGPNDEPPNVIRDTAEVRLFKPGDEPKTGPWTSTVLGRRPVIHAIEVINDFVGDGLGASVLTADNLGVGEYSFEVTLEGEPNIEIETWVSGAPGESPFRGCSEVHIGTLGDAGGLFIATIEPWHGNTVAVHVFSEPLEPPRRIVLDDTLDAGHALWVADVNGDGNDEVFAGHRGKDHRVSVYHHDGNTWHRYVLDPFIAAQDLRGGDLDGDGTSDVVAIGGSTHNLIWYRPLPLDRK